MLMTAFNSLPLPISKSISWTRHFSTHRPLQPVRLGPGITVWPARAILELAENGVARAG